LIQQRWTLSEKPEDCQNHSGFTVYWASLQQSENEASIPVWVEQHGDVLKAEYLQWLHEFGKSEFNGSTIVDHLAVRDDFSLWWMSLPVEKSQWKSSHLYDYFRLMAFERLLSKGQPSEVVISVNDADVAEALAICCGNAGVSCSVESTGCAKSMSIVDSLPHFLQALLLLGRNLLQRFPAKRDDLAIPDESSIAIVSYFFSIDMEKADKGVYRARYWTELHALLERYNLSLHWLHLFVKSAEVSTPRRAFKLIRRFNRSQPENQNHTMLDGPLDWKMVLCVVRDYLKLMVAALRLRDVAPLFRMKGCAVDFWPLMRKEWRSSVYGKTAMLNLLFLNQFESVLMQAAFKRRGFYLLEGQGWERALIYAWRKAGHGELLGVAHTVISAWDLRHFFCDDDFNEDSSLPLPDKVVLNGEAAVRAYRKYSFPMSRIVEGEALRYLYLGELQQVEVKERAASELVLLVLGDILPHVTRKQMELLVRAAGYFPDDIQLWVKEHPACPIDPQEWPSLKMTMIDHSLDMIVGCYQIAFTSNPTAAAVDAYLSGVKVVTMLDPDKFNMSPLRGYPGVDFVATAEELVKVIRCFRNDSIIENVDDQDRKGFFFIDQELPRWSGLLMDKMLY